MKSLKTEVDFVEATSPKDKISTAFNWSFILYNVIEKSWAQTEENRKIIQGALEIADGGQTAARIRKAEEALGIAAPEGGRTKTLRKKLEERLKEQPTKFGGLKKVGGLIGVHKLGITIKCLHQLYFNEALLQADKIALARKAAHKETFDIGFSLIISKVIKKNDVKNPI